MRSVLFSPPSLNNNDIQAVVDVLKSGWITSGTVGEEFTQLLNHYNKAHHTLLTNSATSSLFLALKAMGIGIGDEVITTPYTFVATANVIYHTGAKVIFADVKKNSFYIDNEEIYKKITPKTKAVIPVDFSTAYCHNINFDIISQYFKPNNQFQEHLNRPLILVDSAHALGSRTLDETVDMAAYSFHAVKNLTTAEGGALSISSFGNEELDHQFYQLLKSYALHGQDKSAKEKFLSGVWEYDIQVPGYKSNMPDVLAALGLSQLKRFDHILSHRRKLTNYYIELLKDNNKIIIDEPAIFKNIENSSCHLFPIRIKGFSEEQRNQLISYCTENGVQTNVHYKPLHKMTVCKYYEIEDDYPNSFEQYKNEITLPLHINMNNTDIEYVIEILNKGLKI